MVLWRFLLSIGTNALSHIQKLEVLAPLAVNQERLLTVAEAWHIKNEPKLHMAKTWRGGVNRTCVDLVHDFWKRERMLQKLTLLVPDDYALFPFQHKKAWCDDPLYMGFLPKVRIVVEDGGALFDMQFVLDQGWDVVAMPGSGISKPRTAGMRSGLTTTKAEQVWESDTDLHLAGLSQLFEEQEISTNFKGRRANRGLKGKKLERLLSAFGPCMILAEDISCQCWWCKFDYVFDRSLHKPIGVLYTSLVEVQERQIQDWMEEFECYLGPDTVRQPRPHDKFHEHYRSSWKGDYNQQLQGSRLGRNHRIKNKAHTDLIRSDLHGERTNTDDKICPPGVQEISSL